MKIRNDVARLSPGPVGRTAIAILTLAVLAACSDSATSPDAPPPPPPTPSAAITATGSGNISIHPSIAASHAAAIVFPITLQETGGGTAIWNYLRVSMLLNGAEVERYELGANIIRDAGFRDIAARSTNNVQAVTRFNSTNFDDMTIIAGFADQATGRRFEVMVDFDTFPGVVVDLTPAVVPEGGDVRTQ